MVKFLALLTTSVLAQWQDTEQTTKLWQVIHDKDREALERFVFQYPDVLEARSTDGRGGLWWAWEYGNADALALYLAHDMAIDGDDVDGGGDTAKSMCQEECTELGAEAKELVAGVKERQQEYEDRQEELNEVDADDEEADDDDDGSQPTPAPKAKKESKKVAMDDDEDMFGGGIIPDSEEL